VRDSSRIAICGDCEIEVEIEVGHKAGRCPECSRAVRAGSRSVAGARVKQGAKGTKRFDERMTEVILATGDLGAEYQVIDLVLALGEETGSTNVDSAFGRIKRDLRRACLERGGNAVIFCRFETRLISERAGQPGVQLLGYGTVVRLQGAAN
jgi:hypothetical protein